MEILVNPSAELPIYRQIMRQIVEAIAAERLKGGDKLASHRDLSEQLVVAPLTVKKAYDELEALGYIETQRGRGTFVCEKLPKVDRAEQRERIEEAARNLLSLAYLGGFRLSDIVKVLREVDQELTSESREREKV
jgi:GntR family transcriptional regulator